MEAFSQDLIAGEKQPQFANVRNGFDRENSKLPERGSNKYPARMAMTCSGDA
jgi:hypothetical protein